MRVRIDDQGQLTIPSDVLQQAGLRAGQEIEIDPQGESIRVISPDSFPHLDVQEGLPVIQSAPDTPLLSVQYVNQTNDRLRDGERI